MAVCNVHWISRATPERSKVYGGSVALGGKRTFSAGANAPRPMEKRTFDYRSSIIRPPHARLKVGQLMQSRYTNQCN